mmetsp:Transcript_115503/g.331522  ORF Transcript_115503/g.331522 Transcript_115503/m.331522 type:complete len:240 (-) Transcript_115503:1669-2388(-)
MFGMSVVVKMTVLGRLAPSVTSNSRKSLVRMNSCKTSKTRIWASLSKNCKGLLKHNTSGSAVSARTMFRDCRCVCESGLSQECSSLESKRSRTCWDKPKLLARCFARTLATGMSSSQTPKTKLSTNVLPRKNTASFGTNSVRKCGGTNVDAISSTTRLFIAIFLKRTDLPSAWGPTKKTMLPWWMSVMVRPAWSPGFKQESARMCKASKTFEPMGRFRIAWADTSRNVCKRCAYKSLRV